MRRICFAVLALISTAALGQVPGEARFVPQWVAHCRAQFGAYEITFKSSSGDPTNDDMVTSIKVGEGSLVTIPLKQALFIAGRLASSSRSQCDNISTVTFSSGNTLLLVQRDDRPSENRVSAILLRAKDGVVIDTVFDLGAQVGLAEVAAQDGRARIKLIQRWHESKNNMVEPSPIQGWLRLSDVGGKIGYAWE